MIEGDFLRFGTPLATFEPRVLEGRNKKKTIKLPLCPYFWTGGDVGGAPEGGVKREKEGFVYKPIGIPTL